MTKGRGFGPIVAHTDDVSEIFLALGIGDTKDHLEFNVSEDGLSDVLTV